MNGLNLCYFHINTTKILILEKGNAYILIFPEVRGGIKIIKTLERRETAFTKKMVEKKQTRVEYDSENIQIGDNPCKVKVKKNKEILYWGTY